MQLFGLGRPQPALGVDIGVNAVHAVQLIPHEDRYRIGCVAQLQIPATIMAEDEINDIGQLGTMLKQLRQQCGQQVREVVTAVAGTQVISKIISVTAGLSETAIAEQIEVEADSLIPFPLNEVSYDFESLGPTEDGTQERILVTAARTESINGRVEALNAAGFQTRIVDVEAQALWRATQHLLPHQHPQVIGHDQPLLLLDINPTNMLLLVMKGDEVLFSRHHNIGTDNLLKLLTDKQTPTALVFEQLQQDDLTSFSELSLADFTGNMWQQITRSLQLYQSSTSGTADFSGLVLSGIGAEWPLVQRFLQQQVSYPVVVLDPFALYPLPEGSQHLATHGPRYVQAIGLALRSFSAWHT